VFGDVAILTSTLLLPGNADASTVRLTQIWTRTDGGWKRGWYHATTVEQRQ
jgi:ketosteroid isomerase-like protein